LTYAGQQEFTKFFNTAVFTTNQTLGTVGNGNFGQISSMSTAYAPRVIKFAFKLLLGLDQE